MLPSAQGALSLPSALGSCSDGPHRAEVVVFFAPSLPLPISHTDLAVYLLIS